MSCRIENGRAILSNGKDSSLLKTLRNTVGNPTEADTIYEQTYGNDFKTWLGFDFEKKDVSQMERFTYNLDENNEPKLETANGIYAFVKFVPKNNTVEQQFFPVALADKQKNKVLDLNRSESENAKIQSELINTLVGFINNVKKTVGVKLNTNDLLSKVKEQTLLAAFNNTISVKKAEELYQVLTDERTLDNFDTFIKQIRKEKIELAPSFDVFISAYEQWESKEDSLGNVKTIGTRQLLKESLSRYNMRLKDGTSLLEEIDDEYVRIFNRSRLEDNPEDKLSSQAKAIISSIVVGENSLGYPETLPTDRVYAIVAEAAVSQPDFDEMISRLDYLSAYKPEVKAIVNRLLSLNSSEKAAIFSAFKSTYNEFVLLKEENNNGQYTYKIINSNQSAVASKTKQEFKDNSVEYSTIKNPRAVYIDTNNELSVKPEKLKIIRQAWDVVKTAQYADQWSEQQLDALGVYIWELGMNYGPTLESTQENIKQYYINGNESRVKGGDLFGNFVFGPNQGFERFIKLLETKPSQNFHNLEGTLIKKISDLSILFDSKPFGTFISATNKQYYPINLPTSLDEMVELFNDPKQTFKRKQFIESLKTDPMFKPGPGRQYQSLLLTMLDVAPGEAKQNFINYTLDSYKSSKRDAVDYSSQNDKTSLLGRLVGYINDRNKNFSLVANHIQADRRRLGYVQVPKLNSKGIANAGKFGMQGINRREIIEGLIIQDLARMHQARELIRSKDTSKFIEGYHYKTGSNKYAQDGSVFTMPQIYRLEDTDLNGEYMSDLVSDFVSGQNFTKKDLFIKLLNDKVNQVEKQLTEFEAELTSALKDPELSRVVPKERDKFIKDFIFNEFVMRIEITKLIRSGYSFAKNDSDFYKRMGLLNTPGVKLSIQGFDLNNEDFGMMPQYNALVIKDFDFQQTERAIQVVENLKANGLSDKIANQYLPDSELNKDGVNKSDAQSFISIDMYRGIMQGMGQWDMKLDEDAYKVYAAGGGYNRPVVPLKPYHEQNTVKNGLSTMHMDKNSYTVVTPELAVDFPYLKNMLIAMRGKPGSAPIHVVHTESATKGARVNVQDFQTTSDLDVSNPMVMDSSKLRFPQIIPVDKKNTVTFNRQLRKNLITNVVKDGEYNIGGKIMRGFEVQELFGSAIADNIKEDTARILNELGISKYTSIKNKASIEHKEAKLELLQKLRSRIEKEVEQRDLPQNYLDGLDIIPDGFYNYEFRIPLSFPNFEAKFQTILSGVFNKEIYQQKLKGTETVQIAELGGHVTSGELRMYDGQNGGSEVRIKASTLGFTAEEIEGKTAEQLKGDPRLEFIGYRIPQQGKSSAMVFKVVDFLPESYEKAIMVPGGITVQMGADFDIDKLNLIFKETGKLTPRQERNNTIYNVFKGIILDKKHLEEVMTPVDNRDLKRLAPIVGQADTSINYNNPMSEIRMENRQKMGIAGRGLHSNTIAGRNVAEQLGTLSIVSENTPIVEGVPLSFIKTMDSLGNFTDGNISQYLSAAVDAAKDPIQIDINDNKYTIPVTSVLLSVGVPIETVVYFLAQPKIKALIKNAEKDNIPENKLVDRILKINRRLNVGMTNISLEELKSAFKESQEETERDRVLGVANIEAEQFQSRMLDNFALLHQAGKQLQRVYKVITPDNLDNVNELSSINAWIDEETFFLYNQNSLILGAKDYIIHQQKTSQPLNPIGVAYRGIFDTIIENTSLLGFVQNSAAFNSAKQEIKEKLGIGILSGPQHKFIDRALFNSIMTQPHSPLIKNIGTKAGWLSRTYIKGLYTPQSLNNIVNKTRQIAIKYPKLLNNPFYRLLREDPSNAENGIARIQLDSGINMSTSDKNELSNGLLAIIKDSNPEISTYGKYLVANQFLTSGFSPTYGSYIDLIPSEVFTTDILNPGQGSPVEFFKEEITELVRPNYSGFSNFTHEFVRNFGTSRPGGRDLLRKVSAGKAVNGIVTFPNLDSSVYDEQTGYINYFKSKQGNMYVYLGGSSYQLLAPLGVANKVIEMGTTNLESDSVFIQNSIALSTDNVPNDSYVHMTPDINTQIDNDDPLKVCP